MNESISNAMNNVTSLAADWLEELKNGQLNWRPLAAVLGIILLILILLGWYWSQEPDSFDVVEVAQSMAPADSAKLVTGSLTTATTIHLMDTLLNKPGGYLSNDKLPPGVWLDNIPNWEFGVLVQIRDITRSLRNDFSRSQSQSVEDKDLKSPIGDP